MRMPFKSREYKREYMRRYRRFKKWQMDELKKALDEGRKEDAIKILNMKPNIHLTQRS